MIFTLVTRKRKHKTVRVKESFPERLAESCMGPEQSQQNSTGNEKQWKCNLVSVLHWWIDINQLALTVTLHEKSSNTEWSKQYLSIQCNVNDYKNEPLTWTAESCISWHLYHNKLQTWDSLMYSPPSHQITSSSLNTWSIILPAISQIQYLSQRCWMFHTRRATITTVSILFEWC